MKVLAASGITQVAPKLSAVINSLTPLTLNDSPYAKRVVALIDEPNANEGRLKQDLERVLGDRLFILDRPSIEEYVPAEVYSRAGRDKTDDLARIATIAANGDYKKLAELKRGLAVSLGAAMIRADLDKMPIVKAAAARASDF